MALAFHDLTIAEARRAAGDAILLAFDVPDELKEEYSYLPGQHVTLRAEIDGKDTRRTYSVSSVPGERLSVGIRVQPHGVFSSYARSLRHGMRIAVMTPSGRFFWTGERRLLLVAAGSGITPILSIAGHALAEGCDVTLLYGNRSANSAMLLDQLAMLKDRHITHFKVLHALSRESGAPPIMQGRIDSGRLRRLAAAGIVVPGEYDAAFICGPGAMLADISRAVGDLGVGPGRVHIEKYAPVPARFAPAVSAGETGAKIEAVQDGARKVFTFGPGDTSVIAAALRSGHSLPHSCRGGMCCTCRCKVVEGRFAIAVNYSLEPWELKAGYTLACQTRPLGARLVLDFDAA